MRDHDVVRLVGHPSQKGILHDMVGPAVPKGEAQWRPMWSCECGEPGILVRLEWNDRLASTGRIFELSTWLIMESMLLRANYEDGTFNWEARGFCRTHGEALRAKRK